LGTVLERSRNKTGHFIGKDNIVFIVIFPAMLKAEGSYILPDNVPANEPLGNNCLRLKKLGGLVHEYLEFRISKMFCVMLDIECGNEG
jgi:hypothetical protein